MSEPQPPSGKSRREPGFRSRSASCFPSFCCGERLALTTWNCEIAVLPAELLFAVQRESFSLQGDTLTVSNTDGGYNVFSDGSVLINGKKYTISNHFQRKTQMTSHLDYKGYREILFSKPIVLFTTATNDRSPKGRMFAVVVNTCHPRIRRQMEQGMDQAISSVVGESYSVQFELHGAVMPFFYKGGYTTGGEGLDFSFDFKIDALVDIFYMFGFSKRKVEVIGKVLNLFCTTEEKKAKVKMFLDKMSEPYIKMDSSSDRRFSINSLGMHIFKHKEFGENIY
nr:PREDICTED: mesenteric estrogen-dependent adipogenesis protein [Latimeria chalumnae]|eukprot:XP_006009966.2 PREDICTED: mesenteric estrogen-dependent adipogenesis protein [Latimeria chalumnae]